VRLIGSEWVQTIAQKGIAVGLELVPGP
jgi:hypothetical protein